jgi:aryl-phospho-beta-D-glucosidase BglC (GH1 family)
LGEKIAPTIPVAGDVEAPHPDNTGPGDLQDSQGAQNPEDTMQSGDSEEPANSQQPDDPQRPGESPEPAATDPTKPSGVSYLSVSGNSLIDASGNPVRLTGVNWFGFETANRAPHGLWSRDYRSMLKQMRSIGFNVLRLPYSNAIQEQGAMVQSISFYGMDPYDGTTPINADLMGKSPLEILDLIIAEAGRQGLRVILDNHSREPDGYMEEDLWYTADVSEDQWIADWVEMASRYKNNPVVVGFDLNNEPHDSATWGTGDNSTDWRLAAERCGNAILAVNPDALIIVEGVEEFQGAGYWWGGNLAGVRDYPIRLDRPEKLVYSPHEYGPEVHAQPWFSEPDYPANMTGIWDEKFGFVMNENLGHLFIGEFGIRDRGSHEGRALTWFTELMKYAGDSYSWTFWCWNPNSGDTGGILNHDWVSVQQWKLDLITPYLEP